ncbi:MAG: fructosamine kinase family protein [Leeuwenhoekiella sp.]
MLANSFLKHISELHGFQIVDHKPLSGGDINEVYLLETKSEKLVVKVNDAEKFPAMFEMEKDGLNRLAEAKTLRIPEVIAVGEAEKLSYLILENVEKSPQITDFWEVFGDKIAKLHQNSSSHFGLEKDNYIGSLPQINAFNDNAASFYIEQRLEPQFKLALDKGYIFKDLSDFYNSIEKIIPDEPPALIHGDLWSGNFLIDDVGMPCLIDPAVAYAPREIDLALMQLFGGFDEQLFKTYNEVFPLENDWQERIKLFQLYHVLVHVNLFGGGYFSQAKSIMKQYL